ncbi:glutamate formimidoyltransferase [Kosmotoga pacifica]|uniref:glutamate formimidoyltransferase n=1 Tax=Kosmotoga pacifica TaxID=1330330 RepID=A0A0G2Z6I9_9BACT|nr:glutamate formimidoyltransferase [Kosmotoga pacifica]AKI97215.1 glutamate formiminotransferase [Kosmotoga pacifica]
MKIVESVPNFSEGRRKEIIEAIVQEARTLDKVWVLDYSSDPDHNRSVVTIAGEPKAVTDALFNMSKKAVELIDLRKHRGEHPRMGAVDVIPLVPIMGISKEECVELSKELGKRIGEELKIPVYLYESSATSRERENLSEIRKGEFEGFHEKIKLPEWKPDFGPDKVHPTAGVVAVGCREFLIAFNVNLGTDNIEVARKIAKAVRHISGGFRYVKALGFKLEERGIVQVSMNLTNYKKTPIYRVFEVIKLEAERYGVPIVGSEIVGMVPLNALLNVADFYLRLEDHNPNLIIEKKLLDTIAKEVDGE